MKIIYKIARLELANLFYSPVAWLLLVCLVFMSSSIFMGYLERMAQYQDIEPQQFYGISESIFYELGGGLWRSVKIMLYFAMPLLTMGLISQEFNRGSIKLLFSAPISSYHIVLGKYLGIMLYGLLVVFILFVYVIIAWCCVGSFEWQAVLTGLFGLYLLFGLYAAIGLFMSTLTIYPIVSAIGMLLMLACLQIVSSIGQGYAFIREITYWLAIGKRADHFIDGIISSEDLIYFVILSIMFLCFAILKMQLRRERCSFSGKLGRYLVIFLVTMLLGYLSSRPVMKKYYDATCDKINTLSPASQEIVSRLNGGLKITTYVNLMSMNYRITHKHIKRDMARYERYLRFKPETELNYIFYYHVDTTSRMFQYYFSGKTLNEALKNEVKLNDTRLSRYLTPAQIDARIDLSEERYRFVSLIERESGEKTFLRSYNDSRKLPSEMEITAALKRVAMKLPRVGFVSDHGARSISGDKNRDYSYMMAEKSYRLALINQGFDVEEVRLERGVQGVDSLDILVVAEPLEAFTEKELTMLTDYIDSGKNLILAGKPKNNIYLQPLMERLGLRYEAGMLVQKPLYEQPANLILCKIAPEAYEFSRYYSRMHYDFYTMPGASAINVVEDKGFAVTPLLVTTDTNGWNELQTVDFINDLPSLDTVSGEQAGTKVTMLALNRKCNGREQRIVVMGDADCISMGELEARRRGINATNNTLIESTFDWLSYGELPVNISRPRKIDSQLYLPLFVAEVLTVVLKWIFPLFILLLGILILVRRKGK
ncbi:Gldg family protein [Gabonibacter chumensis]|uniref:Gldg family protein n=1 Tax=Gabonibacter chumensis TaxID=2972474 RepID=UPI002574863F|nr:Gldg family protein [Gabonibacter chumensis]MCR9012331.1 Gldg family protein [Gabonibacter chumensis]